MWRPSTGKWYVRGGISTIYGKSGDKPVPGDYDGDGGPTLRCGARRPGSGTSAGSPPRPYGKSGDKPVPGDYDGDGDADIAVWRPSTGTWYIRGQASVVLGTAAGDVPVPADYNGDGRTDLAIWRPSTDSVS